MTLARTLLALVLTTAIARPCTIFVLTDGTRTLFFNNEDWFNRATRLWFVPAGPAHLGCAYVGFDNGWAQGGLNTAGLAYDWVAGFEENYTHAPELKPVRGNPAERMLESCTTVDEAIAFYRTHREPDFRRSRILVADRTGASVIIGALNGELHWVKLNRSRGYGWGRATVDQALAKSPVPTLENGAAILRACRQPGDGGTKYSNAFDLNSGEIFLYPDLQHDPVPLRLATELAQGGHYYDIPLLREQLAQPPRPLLANMQRFYLDQFPPLADQPPALLARLRRVIEDTASGHAQRTDYTPEFWARLSPRQKEIQADVHKLGPILSLAIVDHEQTSDQRRLRCLVKFAQAHVLGRYVFDAHDRIALIQTDFFEPRPDLIP